MKIHKAKLTLEAIQDINVQHGSKILNVQVQDTADANHVQLNEPDAGLVKLRLAAARIRDELVQAEVVLHDYKDKRAIRNGKIIGTVTGGLFLDEADGLVVQVKRSDESYTYESTPPNWSS